MCKEWILYDLPAVFIRYEDAITNIAGTVASVISGMSVKIPITCSGKIAKRAMMMLMMA